MERPAYLPDFENPPLTEVVLGVQFSPPNEYQQIYAWQVWDLYREKYSKVQEQPPLPPTFETFGIPRIMQPNIGFTNGPLHDRYWFLNEREDELIQFQQDRLLHNWRKAGDSSNDYPRFEKMIKNFEDELLKLEEYFHRVSQQNLNINQCELTYVNSIPLKQGQTEEGSKPENWVELLSVNKLQFEHFVSQYTKIIKANDQPVARLVCDCGTGFDQKRNPIIILNFTVKGPLPNNNGTISAAVKFLRDGRDTIVLSFDEITTEFAHKQWGKK